MSSQPLQDVLDAVQENAPAEDTPAIPWHRELPDAVRAQWRSLGPPVGIFANVDEEQYHAGPGLSSTDIKHLLRSPAHYRAYRSTHKGQTTDVKALGSALHIGILEPWRFASAVVRGLAHDRRTRVNRLRWEEYEQEHANKIIVPHGKWEQMRATIDAVLAHPTASTLLATGVAERSIYWVDDAPLDAHDPTFRLCKARADWIDRDAHGVIVDLKSALDASFTGFARACTSYDYAIQAAWYLHGCARAGFEADAFIFVAFEKTPPYAVGVYELPEQMLAMARHRIARMLKVYDACLESGEWPAYDSAVRRLEFPPWAYRADIM